MFFVEHAKHKALFDLLPSDIIHDIDMWNLVLEHREKLKLDLMQLTEHIPILCASCTFDLTYAHFSFYMHCK